MKRQATIVTAAVILLLLLSTGVAQAGFKLVDKDGNEKIDLGFRLQALALVTDADLDGDGRFETVDDFRIRRARFRLKGTINEHFGMFFQTDVSGNEIQMIDAYIHLRKDDGLQGFIGQHLAPSSRQTITSSGTLMAADRPNIVYKSLTWGVRILNAFATASRGDTDLGVRGPAQVRDTGGTLFGVKEVGSNTHLKYYLGIYDGLPAPGQDSERYTGRLQLNLGDSEPSYYSTATYLGSKNTVAIGLSYDTQSDIGRFIGSNLFQTDYNYWNVDIFAEKPVGSGSLTFEAAYADLDLDGRAPAFEGDGFYLQIGYLINKAKWQPWFLYEDWNSDEPSGRGGGDSFRVGITYFMQGHNANFKLGYEQINTDVNIGSTFEDTVSTLLLGFYTTY